MSLTMQQKADIAAETTKAAPPVTVAGASVAGVTINEMILWTTLIYIVLQIGFLIYRWQRLHYSRQAGEQPSSGAGA